ncbi:GTP-binding protein EhRabX29, putative [Entamoeba histolytica HM-1:IMSS-B]|uniref:GTP-binding protein EhRabX29, putative n=6 Tax=Entamoeba histolytica TaxID=5759 RepID=A0A8U0WP87_ENTH1|eukprot:XP_656310.1 GTP-binding protein EhRabX29, putative [Entamoeba histolytica HM-1:IMSS]
MINRKLFKFGKGVNILFVGEKDCGKTSLITRYINDIYFDSKLDHEESRLKDFEMNGEKVEIKLHEFRQSEYNEDETVSIFRKANAIIFLFPSDVGMEEMQKWMMYVDRFITDDKLWFIIQTKTDLGKMDIPVEQRRTFTFKHSFNQYFEVSSKTGEGVKETMDIIIDLTVKKFIHFDVDEKPVKLEKRQCVIV